MCLFVWVVCDGCVNVYVCSCAVESGSNPSKVRRRPSRIRVCGVPHASRGSQRDVIAIQVLFQSSTLHSMVSLVVPALQLCHRVCVCVCVRVCVSSHLYGRHLVIEWAKEEEPALK